MDRKIWYPGGEPNVNINDLQRDPSAALAAIIAALRPYAIGTNKNFIISGCFLTVIPGVSGSVTAGYIYLNDEVIQVDAQSVPFATLDVYKFTKQTSFDPDGSKIYNNAVFRETWEVNRGILSPSATDPVLPTELDARGADILRKIRRATRGAWVEFDAQSFVLPGIVTYVRAGINGAGTWVITIPYADSEWILPDLITFNFYEQIPGTARGIYEIRDPSGLLIATITRPSGLTLVSELGAWQIQGQISTDIEWIEPLLIQIGAWNMDGDATVLIPHGQSSKEAIRSVTVRITNDALDELSDFGSMNGGWITWDDTNIILTRESSQGSLNGRYDTADFDDIGIDRGTIYVTLG